MKQLVLRACRMASLINEHICFKSNEYVINLKIGFINCYELSIHCVGRDLYNVISINYLNDIIKILNSYRLTEEQIKETCTKFVNPQ